MPTKAEFDAANAATAAALANIEADIAGLGNGLSEADATAVFADVTANQATAERIAAITP